MTLHRRRDFFTLFLSLLLATILCLTALAGCGDKPDENNGEINQNNEGDVPAGAAPRKRVALTFDDGPQHYVERTKKIVDELEKYGYHATFFVVGNRVAGGDALAYAVEKGNEIGIHGYTHEQGIYYSSCSDERYHEEISKTLSAIQTQIPGYQVKLMRPFGGSISEERVKASPYSIIQWSVDSLDYKNTYNKGDSDEVASEKVDAIVNNVMSAVSDGDVILMHDIYESTYDAVAVLLKELYDNGFDVVTVSELFGDELEAGKEYFRLG